MKQNLATVIYGTLTTRLYYSITPSVGQPLKIESIYWFNMLAAGIDYKDHISLVLKECSWLPIHLWTQLKVLVSTFKSQNSQRPRCLKDYLLLYESDWQLCSQIALMGLRSGTLTSRRKKDGYQGEGICYCDDSPLELPVSTYSSAAEPVQVKKIVLWISWIDLKLAESSSGSLNFLVWFVPALMITSVLRCWL